jgi:hypothetical protein
LFQEDEEEAQVLAPVPGADAEEIPTTFFSRNPVPLPDKESVSDSDSSASAHKPGPSGTGTGTSTISPLKSFMKECERCGASVAVWDWVSHSDFHFAKDLQREISGLPPLSNAPKNPDKKPQPVLLPKRIKGPAKKRPKTDTGSGSGSGSGSRRGRPSKKSIPPPAPASATTRMKTLDTYFTPRT